MQLRNLTKEEMKDNSRNGFKLLDKNGNMIEYESNREYSEKELKKLFTHSKYLQKSKRHKISSVLLEILKTKVL
ncbi:MAG: hypothetical protein ACI4N3_05150 [Alphaproteobacteria bacterium]